MCFQKGQCGRLSSVSHSPGFGEHHALVNGCGVGVRDHELATTEKTVVELDQSLESVLKSELGKYNWDLDNSHPC